MEVGAGKDEFELEQQSGVPDSIERLSDIEKDAPAILPLLKGIGNEVNYAKALLDRGVEGAESKLVRWYNSLWVKDGNETLEEEFLDYFLEHGKEVD